jgi:UDP-glucose/iron transport system ATP-binding protein
VLRITSLANDYFGPISLNVAAGECVAISGPSASGKSVFLRAITDLDPSKGDVFWQHRNRAEIPAPEWRRMVSYVPAETGWWADTVAAHFSSAKDLGQHFISVGLPPEAIGWQVARLSTGERHRLGLLRSFVTTPPVLLLDEPTAALDVDATAQIEALLQEFLSKDIAIILVTHDPAQATRLASRTFTMAAGRLSETTVAGTGQQ